MFSSFIGGMKLYHFELMASAYNLRITVNRKKFPKNRVLVLYQTKINPPLNSNV